MYKYLPHIITFFLSIFGSVAQLLFKKAMPLKFNIISLITNYYLIIGFFLYGIAFIGYLLVLNYAPVSQLYPIIAFSYVFIMIFSHFWLGELITGFKIIGSLMIVCGVGLIAI